MKRKLLMIVLSVSLVFSQVVSVFAEGADNAEFLEGSETLLADEFEGEILFGDGGDSADPVSGSLTDAEDELSVEPPFADDSEEYAEVFIDDGESSGYENDALPADAEELPEYSEEENEEIFIDDAPQEESPLFTSGETVPVQTYAAGSSIADAMSISPGVTYSGSITASREADYYKIVLASSGRIKLTASANVERLYYYIYDASGTELWHAYQSWNSTTHLTNTERIMDLTAGTYYIAVKRYDKNYTGTYSFSVTFESAEETFAESGSGNNNMINSADAVVLNKNYRGQLADNDEKDFYRFELASSGRMTLSAEANIERIYYRIYDSIGNQVWYTYQSWNSVTELIITEASLDLTKGTYYLAVERYGRSYTGTYSFKLTFESAGESFAETNTETGTDNEIAAANDIALNTSYKGQIAYNDDKDFYKFQLSSAVGLNFTATANVERIYYYIYDSTGKEVWKKYLTWNDVTKRIDTNETVDLAAGTYYLAVIRYNASYTGPYTFRLATPHEHVYSPVVTKATTTKDGKIVETCSCGAVNGTTIIYHPETISLSTVTYKYSGIVRKPSVTVKGSDGKIIDPSNYSVKYPAGRKNAGTYNVTIEFKGNYSGTVTKTFKITKIKNVVKASDLDFMFTSKVRTFALQASAAYENAPLSFQSSSSKVKVDSKGKVTIAAGYAGAATITVTAAATTNYEKTVKKVKISVSPSKTTIVRLQQKGSGICVQYRKNSVGDGFQIQYSNRTDFKNAKSKYVKNPNCLALTVGSGLKGKWYVRVRVFKFENGKSGAKLFSPWSGAVKKTMK